MKEQEKSSFLDEIRSSVEDINSVKENLKKQIEVEKERLTEKYLESIISEMKRNLKQKVDKFEWKEKGGKRIVFDSYRVSSRLGAFSRPEEIYKDYFRLPEQERKELEIEFSGDKSYSVPSNFVVKVIETRVYAKRPTPFSKYKCEYEYALERKTVEMLCKLKTDLANEGIEMTSCSIRYSNGGNLFEHLRFVDFNEKIVREFRQRNIRNSRLHILNEGNDLYKSENIYINYQIEL